MLIFLRVIIACVFGAAIGSLVRHFTHRHDAAPVVAVAPAPEPVKKPAANAVTDFLGGRDDVPEKKKQSQPIRVCGYIVLNKRVNVVLSDGRTLTELDPELEKIHRNAVFVGGEKLFMKQPKDRQPASAASDVIQPPAAASDALTVHRVGDVVQKYPSGS